MRTHYLLTLVALFLGTMLFAQQPTITPDSVAHAQQWQVRSPLTPEQQAHREKERAELEAMKKRFRDYTEEVRAGEPQRENTNGDFLWAEGEEGGLQVKGGTLEPVPAKETTDSEELRLEIGRQLQMGKSPQAIPPAPVHPKERAEEELPDSYEQDQPTDWQSDIKAAFQPKGQVEIATPTPVAAAAVPTEMQALTSGQIFQLVELDFDLLMPAQILAGSEQELQTWADFLKANPNTIVEVRAHVAKSLDELSAIDLTVQRAKNVAVWLQAQGVKSAQVRHSGWGSGSPLVPADSVAGAEKNERIEFVVLEIPRD